MEEVGYRGRILEGCILSLLFPVYFQLLVCCDMSCSTMPSLLWWREVLETVNQIRLSSLKWFPLGVLITETQLVTTIESLLELSCMCVSCHIHIERHCRMDRRGLEDSIPKPLTLGLLFSEQSLSGLCQLQI